MYCYDFLFDKELLSSRGCFICSFDSSSGMQTVTAGSEIEFTLVKNPDRKKWDKANADYSTYITSSPFNIAKMDETPFTPNEISGLQRWLNRTEFLPFKAIQDGYENIFYKAKFNIKQCQLWGENYGLELTIICDSPFGYKYHNPIKFTIANATQVYRINDSSDEIGEIYPKFTITCLTPPDSIGDLYITNSITNVITTIKNCTNGEIIVLDSENLTITTNKSDHDIANDFNWEFPSIANTYTQRMNTFTFSIPCSVVIENYNPIIKCSI